MEIKGKVVSVGETEEFGNNGFTKRQLIIETDEQYPQKVPVSFVKDKCQLLDSIFPGQSVVIHLNVRSNEYNGKFYIDLQGWKIQ